MKIAVINGANISQLGKRDPAKYGGLNLHEIEDLIRNEFPQDEFTFFQSEIEGEIVEWIHRIGAEFDALIINPGGYSHTSIVIRDALELLHIPKIEVHLSHLANRENFRQKLLTASTCNGYISGFKHFGYLSAVYLIKKIGAKND